jgi:hypothetical protein
VSLAGVYNAVAIEQNVCTLAPAASLGYVFKKDSSGNYPDNDEIYGNDCETSSTAFGQVCYDIIGALSITVRAQQSLRKSLQLPRISLQRLGERDSYHRSLSFHQQHDAGAAE